LKIFRRGDGPLVGARISSAREKRTAARQSKGIDVPPGFATTSTPSPFIKPNKSQSVIADAWTMLENASARCRNRKPSVPQSPLATARR